MRSPAVCVEPSDLAALQGSANALAQQLALPKGDVDDDIELQIVLTPRRLELRWLEPAQRQTTRRGSRGRPIYVDVVRVDATSPQGRSLRQPLARAVGITKGNPYRPNIIDATGGYGEDAWLLASLGCAVTVIERHPVVAALLADGLARAALTEPDIASRVKLVAGDARELMTTLEPADVVYLDPMFPPRRGSALEAKRMRLLRRLAGDDADRSELFGMACQCAGRRVVVKRPLHAGALVDVPTVAIHRGRGVRYDVYSTRTGR